MHPADHRPRPPVLLLCNPQVAVFKLRSAGNWGKVALIDAGVTTDSPCRGFVFTDVAKHTLAAICGPEVGLYLTLASDIMSA